MKLSTKLLEIHLDLKCIELIGSGAIGGAGDFESQG